MERLDRRRRDPSPRLLGFSGNAGALWLHVDTGGAVMILAAIAAWQLNAAPRKA